MHRQLKCLKSGCFHEYQQLSNQLEREMDNELLKWIGGAE